MNYYLVNYIVMENKKVITNNRIGIKVQSFANLDDFKNTISKMTRTIKTTDSIVIKSYEQVYEDDYYELMSILKSA